GGTKGVIEDTANGTGLTYQHNSLAISAGFTSNVVIKNLLIQNFYVHVGTSDVTDIFNDGCINYGSANNITIDHITAHDVHWCMVGNGNNITLSNSDISHVDHGMAFGAVAGQSFSGITVHDIHFHYLADWHTW